MDFDSIDGTRDIMTSDAYKPFIEMIPFPGIADLDSSNLMLAHMQAHLDPESICLFCDPDEFLVLGGDRNADDLLATYTGPLEIERYNMTGLRSEALAGSADLHPFGKMNIRIDRRCCRTEFEKLSGALSSPWIFSDVKPKVLVRISDAISITGGDHSAVVRGPAPQPCRSDTYLLHFPMFSFADFERRVALSRLDFVANPTLPPTFGWHSRRWIRQADEGRLWPEYLSAFVADIDLRQLLNAGSVSIDDSLKQMHCFSPLEKTKEAMNDVVCRPRPYPVSPAPASNEIYIVLGMHRSGTSLCSSILHVLGVDMATDRLADTGNELGHWEREDFVAAQDMILNIMDRNVFSDVHDFPLPPAWWRTPELIPHIRRLTDLVAKEAANGTPFGFKDPRSVKLLPIWSHICARLELQPKFIVCVRNPAHVAKSLEARDGLDRSVGEFRWLDYTVDCFRHTKGRKFHIVHYEDWFSDPIGTLGGLRDFIGSDFGLAGDEALMAVESLIRPDANHGDLIRQRVDLPLVRQFYGLVKNSSGSSDDTAMIDAFCGDFHSFRQLLLPFQAKHQKRVADFEARLASQSKISADLMRKQDLEISELRHALNVAEQRLAAVRQGNAASVQALFELSKIVDADSGFIREAIGRVMNELFSEEWYLEQNSDVRTAGSTGIKHYIEFGIREARDPHPRWTETSNRPSFPKL